jgi:hypothetical protein
MVISIKREGRLGGQADEGVFAARLRPYSGVTDAKAAGGGAVSALTL